MDDLNELKIDLPEEHEHKSRMPGIFGMLFTKMNSDMKFVGIFTIIYGAINCLSIFGAIIGIPLIFAGLRIREAADEYTRFQATNDNLALRRAFEKQGSFFNILKILIIINLVLIVIFVIIFFTMFASFFSAMSGSYDFS